MSSHGIPLPFDDLIAELKRRRFNVGVEQHLRLLRLLEKLQGQCQPEQLKTLLCPIFATDKKQQAEFYRIFDSQYALFRASQPKQTAESAGNLASTPGNGSKALPTSAKNRRRIRYLLPVIVTSVLVATVIVVLIYPHEKSQRQRSPSSLTAPARLPMMQTFTDVLAQHRSALKWGTVLLPLIGLAFWEAIRYLRRNPLAERGGRYGPPFAWRLDVKTLPLADYNSGQLFSIAQKLRRRQIGEVKRLDIALTVAATIEAQGYPHFHFRPDRRFPEYLVLIERAAPRDHQAALFDQLASALEREHVFVDRFFFENDPRVCWKHFSSQRLSLSELQKKFPEHKLLIFSSAEALLDPVSGNLAFWTPSLFEWRERAVLTPTAFSRWGFLERKIAAQFIILPATLEGLDQLADRFDIGLPRDLDTSISPAEEQLPETDGAVEIADLRRYLGESAFQWLCACAIYPELGWDLTVYLGSLTALGEKLVTEHNLLKLIQLPWFRAGAIPDAVRLPLIESLDSPKELAARKAIVNLLEGSRPPNLGSYAYEDWHLTFYSQRVLQYRGQPKRLKLALGHLSRAEVAQDFVMIRLLEKTPISKVSLLLPRGMRKIAFEKGVSLFGLTTAMRAAVTLAVIGIGWWCVDLYFDAEALSLFQAAAAGNSEAMYSLGDRYKTGLGVARDYEKAREWYQKAADAGNAYAKQALTRSTSK